MPVPTRERILDVAWDLFLRQGFAGTTVTQIEAAADLSPGGRADRCRARPRTGTGRDGR
jgi:hypothetical protein